MDISGIGWLFIFLQIFSLLSAENNKSPEKKKEIKIIAENEWAPEQQMCPGLNDRILTDTDVPWGVPGRAYLTVPPEVDIYRSEIPKAGLGAMATTFIPKYTWLGEYEGLTVLPTDENYISWYTWTVYRGQDVQRYIDGGEVEMSNWARFVNMPNNVYDENVLVRECFNRIYYQTSKDIYPGQELLVNYGELYAKTLGVYEELELSDAVRSAELASGDNEEMAELFLELKKLMGQKGKNITSGLKALLKDTNSALSRTFGDKLSDLLGKANERQNSKT